MYYKSTLYLKHIKTHENRACGMKIYFLRKTSDFLCVLKSEINNQMT